MRLPKRRHQLLDTHSTADDSHYLTSEALERLKRTVYELEVVERPKIVEAVSWSRALGDLRENAEYQDAKARMSRIDGRIFSLKQRIKNAILITAGSSADGISHIGSTITVRVEGKEKKYQILGSQESNPAYGKISHLSPLGKALIRCVKSEKVEVETPIGKIIYEIIDIQ